MKVVCDVVSEGVIPYALMYFHAHCDGRKSRKYRMQKAWYWEEKDVGRVRGEEKLCTW